MDIELLDTGWDFKKKNGESIKVDLPYDAMLHEKRTPDAPGLNALAYFPGGEYLYTKHLLVPAAWKEKSIYLHFEGVYHHTNVYVNSRLLSHWDNGYRDVRIDVSDALVFGQENTLQVEVDNSDQPNSRWYSGSGIYRPVYFEILPKDHLEPNGIHIETLSYQEKKIRITLKSNGSMPTHLEIRNDKETLFCKDFEFKNKESIELSLPNAALWSPAHPVLYHCYVRYGEDERDVRFGIRVIEADAKQGLRINGEHLLLNGACIHGDNGLLGACSYPDAEKRKVALLKACGYNAIRCAHNPCSIAFLNACDEAGILVMDEYADMWLMHKTKYDYASYLPGQWENDLSAMVEKDYNHPSVALISLGNEVGESARKEGIALCGKMANYVKEYGNHWLASAGINVFFNLLSSLGLGVYSDKKADKKGAVGSEFFNKLAGKLGDKTMKRGAALAMVDSRIRGVYATLDVAGYNYGILRYKKDHRKYPERVILGSETFCKDAAQYLDLAKKNPALIGDFVWSGMDYLGEAGVGAWEYREYAKSFTPTFGWISAGSGRIDLIGNFLGEALYTQVMFGVKRIEMAVRPLMKSKDHSPSAWKMSDALPSWSWASHEGQKATIEVYARCHDIVLYLNDKLIGHKKCSKEGRTSFSHPYEPGTLKAIGFDEQEKEIGSVELKSASYETLLVAHPETPTVPAKGLLYVDLSLNDPAGIWKPLERTNIAITVTGGKLLGLGNAAPCNEENYLDDHCSTYYGRALAIIQAGEVGKVSVQCHSEKGDVSFETPIRP